MFWEKLNTQIRNACLAIQIKKNSHFRFRSLFSFQKRLFWPKFSQWAWKIILIFFLLKKRKSVYSSFQREIPCYRPLTVFFLQKTPLLTKVQWISMQDVAQIGFFYKEKNPIYSSFQREIPCCRLGKSSTPSWLHIPFSFLFLHFYFVWEK